MSHGASVPQTMTDAEMLADVRCAHNAIYADDEIGGGPVDAFTWRYEPAFDARRIIDGLDPAARADWMRAEIAVEAEDQLDRGWSTMADEAIAEPIVLVLIGDQGYCWDGNHRIGSRCLGADPYLPAIIGTPKTH